MSRPALDAAEALWLVVANVDWLAQPPEWQAAAAQARARYHAALAEAYPAQAGDVVETRVLDVLRSDYRMLARLAADRIAALDAFADQPPPLTPAGEASRAKAEQLMAEADRRINQRHWAAADQAAEEAGLVTSVEGDVVSTLGWRPDPDDLVGRACREALGTSAAPHRAEGLRAGEGPPPRPGWSIHKKATPEKATDELAKAQQEREAAIASAMAATAYADELRLQLEETDRAMRRMGNELEVLRAEVVRMANRS